MKTIRLLALGLCLAWSQNASAGWKVASSDHFLVYSEQSETRLAEYAEQLERLDAAMRFRYKLSSDGRDKANRLTVYVLSNDSKIRNLIGGSSRNVMGFYVPRASGSVAFVPQRVVGGSSGKFDLGADTVLFHEYAHHFFYQNFTGSYPLWFSEAFAEFFSTVRFESDGGVGIGLPALHRAYSLAMGRSVPMQKLLSATPGELDADRLESLYSRGWALLHMLTFADDRPGQLERYLSAINRGEANKQASFAAFGDMKQLDRAVDSYVRRPRLPYIKIDKAALDTGQIEVRTLSEGEDAMLDIIIVSRRGVNRTQAAALAPKARAIGARYPDNAFIQAALAEAEFDAGNDAAAGAAADRALAIDAKSSHAATYRAMVKMRHASGVDIADDRKAAWVDARKAIVAANRLDPDDPQSLVLYYRSFLEAGEAAPEIAKAGLIQAQALAPGDHGLTMNTAMMYLRDGKFDKGTTMLASLTSDAHGGELGRAAAKLIDDIAAAGGDQAKIAALVAALGDKADEPSAQEPGDD